MKMNNQVKTDKGQGCNSNRDSDEDEQPGEER